MNINTVSSNKLYRSDDSVLFGVCGGIAEYFDLSSWGVRLVWVLLMIPAFPIMLIGYVVLALLLKRRPLESAAPRGSAKAWNGEWTPRSEMLAGVQRRFDTLDQRLQRMESIVTSPAFDLENKCRNL
ncbi:MAG: PspC domain-containing protein [bacterium]|nr:PspC domain-containing protein [Candidatus Sumerlaeota bacterium]